jgi:uncharacterized protein involved in high-affinity Fe2+ transport
LCTIEKVDTKFKETGAVLAMTAKDGPHYANNVALMGDGDYRLTYHLEPTRMRRMVKRIAGCPMCSRHSSDCCMLCCPKG